MKSANYCDASQITIHITRIKEVKTHKNNNINYHQQPALAAAAEKSASSSSAAELWLFECKFMSKVKCTNSLSRVRRFAHTIHSTATTTKRATRMRVYGIYVCRQFHNLLFLFFLFLFFLVCRRNDRFWSKRRRQKHQNWPWTID